MANVRIKDGDLLEEVAYEDGTEGNARKRVRGVIRSWLTSLETTEGWQGLSQTLRQNIRRSIIRAVWSAYKIGLFEASPVVDEENTSSTDKE